MIPQTLELVAAPAGQGLEQPLSCSPRLGWGGGGLGEKGNGKRYALGRALRGNPGLAWLRTPCPVSERGHPGTMSGGFPSLATRYH